MKKNDILKIVIIVSFIIIAVCIIMRLKPKDEKEVIDDYEDTKIYMENKVFPQGMFYIHKNYKGDLNVDKLYYNFNSFCTYLPQMQKELKNISSSEYEKYFDENLNDIKNIFGITEFSEFYKIANYIVNMKDIGEYASSQIDENSFEYPESYMQFKINFNFSCVDNMVFNVKFSNSKENSISIIYGL